MTVGPHRELPPFVGDARGYAEDLDSSADGRHIAVAETFGTSAGKSVLSHHDLRITDTSKASPSKGVIRPDFRPGDTVKVHIRIIEGSKERVQVFQGVVTKRKHGTMNATYTVRKWKEP